VCSCYMIFKFIGSVHCSFERQELVCSFHPAQSHIATQLCDSRLNFFLSLTL
jgi:hypothetical protein